MPADDFRASTDADVPQDHEGDPLRPSRESGFYAPADANALRMENELLAFEVRFLKARLGRSGLPPASTTMSSSRLAQLEDAERHLRMVLGRLSAKPFGPVLRRSGRFRFLQQRYLGPGSRHAQAGSPERLAQLEEAERDLKLLVGRLSGSPLGRILRLRKEFRLLEQRYL